MNPPPELVRQIAKGNAVVFVGAGLSVPAGLPSWPRLLRSMLEWGLEHDVALPDRAGIETLIERGELLLVADLLRQRLGRADFRRCLKAIFDDPQPRPTAAHEILVRIPFSAALTSNYDRLLETAYTTRLGTLPKVITHRDGPELGAVLREDFYVLKLHGTLDRIDTIVLGQSDFREITHAQLALQQHLRTLFSMKTVLFLGFGLKDPDLRFVLDYLNVIYRESPGTHYALMISDSVSDLWKEAYDRYYGIKFISYRPSAADHPEVHDFLERLAAQVEAHREGGADSLASSGPSVRARATPGARAVDGREETGEPSASVGRRIIEKFALYLQELSEGVGLDLMAALKRLHPADLALTYLEWPSDRAGRQRALRALASMIDGEGRDGVLVRLFSDEIEVVLGAIDKLADQEIRSHAMLLAALALDAKTSRAVRQHAVTALSGFGVVAVEPILLVLGLREPSSEEVTIHLLRAADETVIAAIREALRSPRVVLRRGAAIAAGLVLHRVFVEPLREIVSDPVPDIAQRAKRALRRIVLAHGRLASFRPRKNRRFEIVGDGETGSKAKALALLADYLESGERKAPSILSMPYSLVVASSDFEETMRRADLGQGLDHFEASRVAERLCQVPLAADVEAALRQAPLWDLDRPLIVRSSSLLEGSLNCSLAGMYTSVWVPTAVSTERRLIDLRDAIRRVQASVWNDDVKEFRQRCNFSVADERMAVLIQTVVGRWVGQRYLPLASGLALSRNFYPWTPEGGRDAPLIRMVYGLGTRAVDRGPVAMISPGAGTLSEMLRDEEDAFVAGHDDFDFLRRDDAEVHSEGVTRAFEADGEWLRQIVEVIDGGRWREFDETAEVERRPKLVTFAPLLKSGRLGPKGAALRAVLREIEELFEIEVAVEFALSDESGSLGADGGGGLRFNALQVRPMETWEAGEQVDLPDVAPGELLVRSAAALGNAQTGDVHYLVSVLPKALSPQLGHRIQESIQMINQRLGQEGYVLIGRGWWGASFPGHGVPVRFGDISNARALVEVLSDLTPEPSLGGHLITNLIENAIPLLSVHEERGGFLNREWLEAQPEYLQYDAVKLIHVPSGVGIAVDGRKGKGVVYLR